MMKGLVIIFFYCSNRTEQSVGVPSYRTHMRLTIYNVQHSDYGTIKCVGTLPFHHTPFCYEIFHHFPFVLQLKILAEKQTVQFDSIVSGYLSLSLSVLNLLALITMKWKFQWVLREQFSWKTISMSNFRRLEGTEVKSPKKINSTLTCSHLSLVWHKE